MILIISLAKEQEPKCASPAIEPAWRRCETTERRQIWPHPATAQPRLPRRPSSRSHIRRHQATERTRSQARSCGARRPAAPPAHGVPPGTASARRRSFQARKSSRNPAGFTPDKRFSIGVVLCARSRHASRQRRLVVKAGSLRLRPPAQTHLAALGRVDVCQRRVGAAAAVMDGRLFAALGGELAPRRCCRYRPAAPFCRLVRRYDPPENPFRMNYDVPVP